MELWVIRSYRPPYGVTFSLGPLVLIGLIAWFTVSMFTDVYHMCADTILMCYIADEEAHNGIAKFASQEFKSYILEHGAVVPGRRGTDASKYVHLAPVAGSQPPNALSSEAAAV